MGNLFYFKSTKIKRSHLHTNVQLGTFIKERYECDQEFSRSRTQLQKLNRKNVIPSKILQNIENHADFPTICRKRLWDLFFSQILKGKYIVIMLDELRKPRPLAFGFHIKKFFFQGEKIIQGICQGLYVIIVFWSQREHTAVAASKNILPFPPHLILFFVEC